MDHPDCRHDAHPGFPRRPLLRPGVLWCRRSGDQLQVGLADDLMVVVSDHPEVRALLTGLEQGIAPPDPLRLTPEARRACSLLLERQLVVDADVWCRQLGADTAAYGEARSSVVAEAGLTAAAVFRVRAELRVAIDSHGLPQAHDRLVHLLNAAGLAVVTGGEPDLVVLLRRGELSRSSSDELMRAGRRHVVLTVSEGRVRLGPFVHPSLTACVRCIDAHHHERDPRREVVVQQYADARGVEASGLPAPVPVDLLDVAVGLLARDLTGWADGTRPATWSRTIDIDPALDLPRTLWRRHPACGCSWTGALAV
jgi:hypothetical protein